MTVASSSFRNDYIGNGVTVAFTGQFRILDSTHITVIRTQISTGVATTLALVTDYNVSGVGDTSFTVTCNVAPTTDQRISILRNVPLNQLSSYPLNDVFPSTTTEQALDKLTMVDQQQQEQLNRSLTLPPNASGVSAALPSPQGGAVLGWNAGGTAIENQTVPTSTFATPRTSSTGAAAIPAGTTAQRDSAPLTGYFRYNTTLSRFEGYTGSVWDAVGKGATGGGTDTVFFVNKRIVTTAFTIAADETAISGGPITTNATVTVNGRWVIL